jgi:hypothetical protein
VTTKTRKVGFVLLGVAALVLKRHYSGPFPEMVQSYGGNVAASFAVYFIVALFPFTARPRKLLIAALAFAVVGVFECTDGFGVMGNVYDPVDLAADAVGVGLALVADAGTEALSNRISERLRTADSGTGESGS